MLKPWLNKKWLLIAVFAYVVVFSSLSLVKYLLFLYDSIDLAIFNQVFWNTIHGHPFWLTITSPHSYLGDHASLLMILQMPIYALFPHPYTLLILQTFALAGAAIPLFLIAKIMLATIIITVSTLYIGLSLGPLVPDNRATLSEIISRRRASDSELAFVSPDDAVLTETWRCRAPTCRRANESALTGNDKSFLCHHYQPALCEDSGTDRTHQFISSSQPSRNAPGLAQQSHACYFAASTNI